MIGCGGWLSTAEVLVKGPLSFITYRAKKGTKNVCVVWNMGRTEVAVIKMKIISQNSYLEGMVRTERK